MTDFDFTEAGIIFLFCYGFVAAVTPVGFNWQMVFWLLGALFVFDLVRVIFFNDNKRDATNPKMLRDIAHELKRANDLKYGKE